MNVHSFSLKGLRDQNEDRHDVILNINNKNKNMKDVNFLVYMMAMVEKMYQHILIIIYQNFLQIKMLNIHCQKLI